MPSSKKGESLAKFLKRCIPEVVKEGKSQAQATAQCASMYRQAKKKRISKALKKRI